MGTRPLLGGGFPEDDWLGGILRTRISEARCGIPGYVNIEFMANTIFFSWQSDTPAKQGRYFVEDALRDAIRKLSSDATIVDAIRDELELDKDTKGIPGTPPIFDAILSKIDTATIFVPDLTFVGTRSQGSPTPNPNVLIEYGYALKTLGSQRTIAIMNEAHGKPTRNSMPFDMAHLRFPITYSLSDDAEPEDRKSELRKLTATLVTAIGDILKDVPSKASLPSEQKTKLFTPMVSPEDSGNFRISSQPVGFSWNTYGNPSRPIYVLLGSTIWLRVMPYEAQNRTWSIKELRDAIDRSGGSLTPMIALDPQHLKEADGCGIYERTNNSQTSSVAFAFESGEIWSMDSAILGSFQQKLYMQFLLEKYTSALSRYAIFLQKLGISPPFQWIAGIDGVKNWELITEEGYIPGKIFSGPTCMSNRITKTGIFTPEESPKIVLRPFFEEICRKSGVDYPAHPPFI
jgi:hypothetical protein